MEMEQLEKLAGLLPDITLRQALPLIQWIDDLGAFGARIEMSGQPYNFEFAGMSLPAFVHDAPVAAPLPDPIEAAPVAPVPQPEVAPDPVRVTTEPPRKINVWTDAEKDRAMALKAEGYTIREIADQLGRPEPGTGWMLRKLRDERKAQRQTERQSRPVQKPVPAPQQEVQHAAAVKPGKSPEAPAHRPDRAEPRTMENGGSVDRRTDAGGRDIGSGPREIPDVAEQRPAARAEKQSDRLDHLGGLDVADAPRVGAGSVAPPAAPPAPRLTIRQKRIFDHLKRLSDDFTVEDDLYLAQEITGGTPPEVVADELGCDMRTVVTRLRAMQVPEILTAKNMLTIDGQADLMVAVRCRAGQYA